MRSAAPAIARRGNKPSAGRRAGNPQRSPGRSSRNERVPAPGPRVAVAHDPPEEAAVRAEAGGGGGGRGGGGGGGGRGR